MNHKLAKAVFPLTISCYLIDYEFQLIRVVMDRVKSNEEIDTLVQKSIEIGGNLTKYVVVALGIENPKPIALYTHGIVQNAPDRVVRRFYEIDRSKAHKLLDQIA